MGGRRDKSGTVKKEAIIDLVKNEFELTFDIEQLLAKFGVDREELDFQSFCTLFENTGDKDKASKKKDIMVDTLHISETNNFRERVRRPMQTHCLTKPLLESLKIMRGS